MDKLLKKAISNKNWELVARIENRIANRKKSQSDREQLAEVMLYIENDYEMYNDLTNKTKSISEVADKGLAEWKKYEIKRLDDNVYSLKPLVERELNELLSELEEDQSSGYY